MFIDHKYVFFETSGFLFYILTEGRPTFDHPLGFFSKEKISYNDYNLACIITFPPYQKRGFGSLMIEFSKHFPSALPESIAHEPTGYELSARTQSLRRAGTPERPLSDLGLRGYLQFWTSVLIRYFRLIFYTRNDPRLVDPRDFTQLNSSKAVSHKKHTKGWQGEAEEEEASNDALLAIASSTPATAGPGPTVSRIMHMQDMPSSSANNDAIGTQNSGGPLTTNAANGESVGGAQEPASTVAGLVPDDFEMRFSLAEIANATRLREDDVSFTLLHAGLARFRTPASRSNDSMRIDTDEQAEMEVVISPALVEEVATRMRVKPPVMSRIHCLL